jgi:hypothetical protein
VDTAKECVKRDIVVVDCYDSQEESHGHIHEEDDGMRGGTSKCHIAGFIFLMSSTTINNGKEGICTKNRQDMYNAQKQADAHCEDQQEDEGEHDKRQASP